MPRTLKENELRQQNIEYILDKIHFNRQYLDTIAAKLGYNTEFNETFWKFPMTLWHCTPEENVQEILKDGLLARHESRGIVNRSISRAVFTTMEWEEVPGNQMTYGDGVIEIDTPTMKKHGITPYVSMEPDWEEAILLAAVYTRLTKKEHYDDHFISSSEGTSKYTVIIHDEVPPQFLKEV